MIWHIYSGLQCSEGEGGIHLPSSRHTSPHPCPPAKKFWHRSEHFFFSRGLFPGGLVASLPQVCELEPGEALSPAPLAAGTCRLQFRGGEHVPVTSPRGQTPASSLISRGELGLGASQQPLPRVREGGESTEGPVMMVRVITLSIITDSFCQSAKGVETSRRAAISPADGASSTAGGSET